MDFNTATDRLFKCDITAADIADVAGVQPDTVRHWRLDPSKGGYRSPPEDWCELLVQVARARVAQLVSCSEDLEALAAELEERAR